MNWLRWIIQLLVEFFAAKKDKEREVEFHGPDEKTTTSISDSITDQLRRKREKDRP